MEGARGAKGGVTIVKVKDTHHLCHSDNSSLGHCLEDTSDPNARLQASTPLEALGLQRPELAASTQRRHTRLPT